MTRKIKGLSAKPVKGYTFKSYNHERKKEMDEKMAKLRAKRKKRC